MVDAEHRRVLETLAGILEGIAVDQEISAAELQGLKAWLEAHQQELRAPIFVDVRRRVKAALQQGLTPETHTQLLQFCREFAAKHRAAHPSTRDAFARLQGMALGVLADGRLDDAEIFDLRDWLERYADLRHHFVFGAFFDMLDAVLADGVIDLAERAQVTQLCETFGAPPPPRELPAGFTPTPVAENAPRRGDKHASVQWPPLPELISGLGPVDYVALDLETASHDPASVCALGLAIVRTGAVDEAGASLIDPQRAFDRRHIRMHGIHAGTVAGAPTFKELWPALCELLADRWVLAHNATFTRRCLQALLRVHELELGAPPKLICTLKLSRAVWPRASSHALSALAAAHGIAAPGHDPVAGARACAELGLRMCERRGLDHPWRVAAELGVEATRLQA